MSTDILQLGVVVHGFCGGYFGSDSYNCRTIEAVGPDWIVTRNAHGDVELGTNLPRIARLLDDRSYCHKSCTGSEGDLEDPDEGDAA